MAGEPLEIPNGVAKRGKTRRAKYWNTRGAGTDTIGGNVSPPHPGLPPRGGKGRKGED
ncbi:MAG: hypothetical protein KJ686_04585 [Actinobacteria bacterium]|nr:hypothetical protein [Actinomycetota bacterium]